MPVLARKESGPPKSRRWRGTRRWRGAVSAWPRNSQDGPRWSRVEATRAGAERGELCADASPRRCAGWNHAERAAGCESMTHTWVRFLATSASKWCARGCDPTRRSVPLRRASEITGPCIARKARQSRNAIRDRALRAPAESGRRAGVYGSRLPVMNEVASRRNRATMSVDVGYQFGRRRHRCRSAGKQVGMKYRV